MLKIEMFKYRLITERHVLDKSIIKNKVVLFNKNILLQTYEQYKQTYNYYCNIFSLLLGELL